MIRTYFLPVLTIEGEQAIAGSQYIHDAVIVGSALPDMTCLIMDTDDLEHSELADLAQAWWESTASEIKLLKLSQVKIEKKPHQDEIKAILANSPPLIPYPDCIKVIKYLAGNLGYLQ